VRDAHTNFRKNSANNRQVKRLPRGIIKICCVNDIDKELQGWLKEAYG